MDRQITFIGLNESALLEAPMNASTYVYVYMIRIAITPCMYEVMLRRIIHSARPAVAKPRSLHYAAVKQMQNPQARLERHGRRQLSQGFVHLRTT